MNNPFELLKTRELTFSDEPGFLAEQAFSLLNGMENMKVEIGKHPNSLIIHYSLEHYTHEGLENALTKEGFHFKESLLDMVHKQVVHYCEDVQRHNMITPEHPTKKNESEVFAKVYEQQQHDIHDEPRKDVREYK
jgi:glutamate mutase epsilon subunit